MSHFHLISVQFGHMTDLTAFLAAHDIRAERFEHPAVFTCEESSLLPPMPGAPTKNLFIRDRKGERQILVTVPHEKSVDLKALKELIDADKLSFASPERLWEYLGVEPGSVTLMGLIHDLDHRVEVIVDAAIWNAESVQCHPLVNTATLVFSHSDLEKFIQATGHKVRVLDVPGRQI